MSKRDILKFEGCALAWQRALGDARVQLEDLSFIETYDCFTIAELIEYEAMGLTAEGRGAVAALEAMDANRWTTSGQSLGGAKTKGHPIGATGVSMHVLTARQLCGDMPPPIQISNAQLGGVFNMGGAAVANYVSVLERLRRTLFEVELPPPSIEPPFSSTRLGRFHA